LPKEFPEEHFGAASFANSTLYPFISINDMYAILRGRSVDTAVLGTVSNSLVDYVAGRRKFDNDELKCLARVCHTTKNIFEESLVLFPDYS